MSHDRHGGVDIDASTEGSRLSLRFPPLLERHFEAETGAARSRSLVWRGLVGVAFFVLYLGADYLLTPDAFDLAIALRLGIVLPLALIAIALLLRNPPPLLRETMVGAVSVLAGTSTLIIMLASTSPLRDDQQDAVILVLLFLVAVERLRFPVAIASTLAMSAIFCIATALTPSAGAGHQIADMMVFCGAAVLTLVAGYTLEREGRRGYVLGLRERLRSSSLEAQTLHDPLTGLENRRALDEAISRLAGRDGIEVAVILADIDHFKAYNDTLGHLAGDLCLKRAAGLIAAELRNDGDRAMRYGGEEFLVLLPDTDLGVALAVAERMRAAIEAAAIPNPGRPFQRVLTMSFGVAASRLGPGMLADELIRSADAALYTAKAAGRNQVWPLARPVGHWAERGIDRIRRAEGA